MKAYTVEKTENSLTIGFKDANSTLITPMIKALNDDKNVALVRYIDQHPELSDVMLYIEMNKGDPEEAVKKAAKTVSSYFSSVTK